MTFPVGGPRQPVYDLLMRRGFVMSAWSDKEWKRADGVEAHIYGAGSMVRIVRDGKVVDDGEVETVLSYS